MLYFKTKESLNGIESKGLDDVVVNKIKDAVTLAQNCWEDRYTQENVGIDIYYFSNTDEDMVNLTDLLYKYNLIFSGETLNDICFEDTVILPNGIIEGTVVLTDGDFNLILFIPQSWFKN